MWKMNLRNFIYYGFIYNFWLKNRKRQNVEHTIEDIGNHSSTEP